MLGIFVASLAFSCSQGQTKLKLAPRVFADKITQSTKVTVLDVRTPEEFIDGHLAKARNIDWNGEGFENEVVKLDKSKPVFVYCLSGGRSASAASRLRSMGFREVYELDGGIKQWRDAKLPLIKD